MQNTRGCTNNWKDYIEGIMVFSLWKCSLAWSPSWDLSPSLEPEMLLDFCPSFPRGGSSILLVGAVFNNSTSTASLGQELSPRGCHTQINSSCGWRFSSTSPTGFAVIAKWSWILPVYYYCRTQYFLVTFPREFIYTLKKGEGTSGPSSIRSFFSLRSALSTASRRRLLQSSVGVSVGHCSGASGVFQISSSGTQLWLLCCQGSCKSEWPVHGKRECSGLMHTGVESCQDIIWCQSRHLQSLLVPAALLGTSSKFPFHTEGQENLFGTQSVINIPLFSTPSKGVSTSQFLSTYNCTQVSLWKLLCKQHQEGHCKQEPEKQVTCSQIQTPH